jgi:hypothetical protein
LHYIDILFMDPLLPGDCMTDMGITQVASIYLKAVSPSRSEFFQVHTSPRGLFPRKQRNANTS